MKRIDIDFIISGTRCAAWLYLPDRIKPPVVIMAHGFGAQRDFGLPPYAEKFVQRGLAVFLFDYRNFGDSDGEPRNLVSPRRHLKDWKAAIAHVRKLQEVDTERIALWGTSFSGGHTMVTAASDRGVRAVVSQVPFVNGIATTLMFSLKYQLTATIHGIRDLFRLITFRKPHYVPIVEDPDRFAVMNTPESKPGIMALVPPGSIWKNECPARIFFTLPLYRPIAHAKRIQCPVLLIIAEKDSLIPLKAVEKTASKIKKSEAVRMPVGHFEVYTGPLFDRVSDIEADFLCKHLA